MHACELHIIYECVCVCVVYVFGWLWLTAYSYQQSYAIMYYFMYVYSPAYAMRMTCVLNVLDGSLLARNCRSVCNRNAMKIEWNVGVLAPVECSVPHILGVCKRL